MHPSHHCHLVEIQIAAAAQHAKRVARQAVTLDVESSKEAVQERKVLSKAIVPRPSSHAFSRVQAVRAAAHTSSMASRVESLTSRCRLALPPLRPRETLPGESGHPYAITLRGPVTDQLRRLLLCRRAFTQSILFDIQAPHPTGQPGPQCRSWRCEELCNRLGLGPAWLRKSAIALTLLELLLSAAPVRRRYGPRSSSKVPQASWRPARDLQC